MLLQRILMDLKLVGVVAGSGFDFDQAASESEAASVWNAACLASRIAMRTGASW